MNKANVLKYLNPLLAVSFLIQFLSGVSFAFGYAPEWLGELHEYNGFLFIVLVLCHLYLNWNWVRAAFFIKKEQV